VQPNGSKLWRHKYRHLGIEKKLSIGPYPEISVSEARRRRDAAREQLHSGFDPSRKKVKARQHAEVVAGCTFTLFAEEYCTKRNRDGANAWATATATRCEYLLSLLDGSIGKLPITDIAPIDVLEVVVGRGLCLVLIELHLHPDKKLTAATEIRRATKPADLPRPCRPMAGGAIQELGCYVCYKIPCMAVWHCYKAAVGTDDGTVLAGG
jgi:hypothetical protein